MKRRARVNLLCGTICLTLYEKFKGPLTEFAQGPRFHRDDLDSHPYGLNMKLHTIQCFAVDDINYIIILVGLSIKRLIFFFISPKFYSVIDKGGLPT
jgi:hypothetical protein